MNTKKVLSFCTAAALTLSIAACSDTADAPGASGSGNPETGGQEIVITYPTYRVGTHISARSEKEFIDGFNEKYAGIYRVEVEELPSDQSYAEKMKVLASSNALPDVVEGKDGIRDLAIRNGQAIDLTEMLNADPEFKAEIGDGAIAANTIDGKLYSISNGNQLIGYFYNKEHFEKAGITPAKTWDEFESNCEKLLAAGYTPISLMTGENCWTTNLCLSSMIGTANEAGNTLMNTMYPETYETPEVEAALQRMQTFLSKYTTKDALGAGYDVAANHFLQGETSIICNGPWMTGDFTNPEKAIEGLGDKIGVALYPEGGIFSQYEIGYMICTSDPDKQKAAFEFIKYKTNAEAQKKMLEYEGILPLTSNVEISDEYAEANPLMVEIINLSGEAKYQYRTLDAISYAGVIEEMANLYPSLAAGDITAAEMCTAMTEAAAKSK